MKPVLGARSKIHSPVSVRWRRVLVLCCIGVALAGCTAFYNYRFAGWWLRWQIEDYVPWNSSQQSLVRARLDEQLRWHQRTQLPRYRTWLEQARSQIDTSLTAEQVGAQIEQLRAFWADIMLQVEPDFAQFLSDLSDRQTRDVIRRLREEHADTIEEYAGLSLEKLAKERERNMRKGIERITGSLEAPQRTRIHEWAGQMLDNRATWLSSRERWIDSFEQALERRSEGPYFGERIHALFIEPEQSWDPEYQQRLEHNTALTRQLLADIHNSLSARQRVTADKNTGKWLDTLDELAREHY